MGTGQLAPLDGAGASRGVWVVGRELTDLRVAFMVANDGIEEAELSPHSMVDAGLEPSWWRSSRAWPRRSAT